jgi:hypothetical protein
MLIIAAEQQRSTARISGAIYPRGWRANLPLSLVLIFLEILRLPTLYQRGLLSQLIA